MAEEDRAELLGQIREIVPAPYVPKPPRVKTEFLRNLGIQSKTDLFRFGL